MPARPWYPWFPADYMQDTILLSLEEDALYRRLLDLLWIHGGELPNDETTLARLCRTDLRKFRRLWRGPSKQRSGRDLREISERSPRSIKELFDSNGRIRQKRMTEEILKASDFIEKRRESGRKGGQASAKAKLDLSTTTTTVERDPVISTPSKTSTGSTSGNGADAPIPDDPKNILWDWAIAKGFKRNHIGRLIRDYGENEVIHAMIAARNKNPVEIKSYIEAILKKSISAAGQWAEDPDGSPLPH